MKAFLKTLPQTIVGLVFLTVITIFGFTGTLSSSGTYQAFLALLTLVGATGIWILASNWENVNASPNLIVGLASMVALIVLGLHHIFTSDQITYTMTLVLMGSAVGVGGPAIVSAVQKKVMAPYPDGTWTFGNGGGGSTSATFQISGGLLKSIIDPGRKAGKRGLRRGQSHPQLRLANFRTATPAPPPTGDVTHGITDWGMDGNDQYGDCGPAATDHYQVAKAGDTSLINKLGGVGPVPLYFEYGSSQGEPGPQPDQGVDNPTWLKFLFDKGIIEAFAEVDHTNVDEVHQAMLDFGGVLISVSLTDDAEQLFNSGQPWTLAHGESPDPNEGHDILLAKYGPEGDTFVTWGALQPATVQWDSGCITGAYVIVTSEDAARTGVDIAALQAQIRALGGTTADTPPQPVPALPPTPPSGVAEWFHDFLEWIESI